MKVLKKLKERFIIYSLVMTLSIGLASYVNKDYLNFESYEWYFYIIFILYNMCFLAIAETLYLTYKDLQEN